MKMDVYYHPREDMTPDEIKAMKERLRCVFGGMGRVVGLLDISGFSAGYYATLVGKEIAFVLNRDGSWEPSSRELALQLERQGCTICKLVPDGGYIRVTDWNRERTIES